MLVKVAIVVVVEAVIGKVAVGLGVLLFLVVVTGCSIDYTEAFSLRIGREMDCARPIWLDHYEMLAPCGKCPACKKSRSREWAARLAHEAPYWGATSFVTLTYDDEHLKPLSKRDLQLFFKRLRSYLKEIDRKCSYFACGEHGTKNGRPHFHAIIFGIAVKEKYLVEMAWTFGLVHVGDFSPASARYVTNYMLKDAHHLGSFRLMSQGIGARYAHENADLLRKNLGFKVNGQSVSLPRTYAKIAGITSEELSEKNKELREDLAKEMKLHHRSNKDLLSTIGYRNKIIQAKLELFGKRN